MYRAVYWFMFPALGVLVAFLHLNNVGLSNFLVNSLFNILFIVLILALLLVYIYNRTGKFTYKGSLGIGDILMLFSLCFSFATLSYSLLLVFGLIFSLITHIIIVQYRKYFLSRKRSKHPENSVPLAGYLAMYFTLIYLSSWTGLTSNLYLI